MEIMGQFAPDFIIPDDQVAGLLIRLRAQFAELGRNVNEPLFAKRFHLLTSVSDMQFLPCAMDLVDDAGDMCLQFCKTFCSAAS